MTADSSLVFTVLLQSKKMKPNGVPEEETPRGAGGMTPICGSDEEIAGIAQCLGIKPGQRFPSVRREGDPPRVSYYVIKDEKPYLVLIP